MKVLKFGGTSVGTPSRMKEVRQIISRDDDRKIVVLSAVSGTTNALVALSNKHERQDRQGTEVLLKELYEKYVTFVKELYETDKYREAGQKVVDKYFSVLKEYLSEPFSKSLAKAIVVQGEMISTNLFINYLAEHGDDAALIDAADYMTINESHEPDLHLIEEKLKNILSNHANRRTLITQGFICRNASGEIDNLKRGGSDYSATLIAAAIGADEAQIWTDIDGMHNNDPRIVESTFPIAELSFDEAGELAYFGAKILHPNCIIPAQLK
ncbi:MAG: aspartate kinase, partial [Cyclobacteriaceae bacterium]